jgi:ubiquinone/menaquinone biosynthesis C-methylase UbiE
MKRGFTNVMRYCMDELLPLALRDNYYFMYPFYRYWFGGSDLNAVMRFKEIVHTMSDQEFAAFYETLKCRANIRPTDCSEASLKWVLDRIDVRKNKTLLDVGCGRGHCIEKFMEIGLDVTGCDVYAKPIVDSKANYVQGNVEQLPFADGSFDVVTCFHTLEHVRRLSAALQELKRVARHQLFLIVPQQRFFRFTLDLHIHFFYSPVYFQSLVNCPRSECAQVGGDIVYCAYIGRDEISERDTANSQFEGN